jgi:hypothetical protein
MVLILANKADITSTVRLLDILDGYILLAIDVNREQVHIAPKDILEALKLLVENNIATLQKWIHRISYHIDSSVTLWQIWNVDIIDRLNAHAVGK